MAFTQKSKEYYELRTALFFYQKIRLLGLIYKLFLFHAINFTIILEHFDFMFIKVSKL